MPASPTDFNSEARAATAELLWRQWTTLGVSGHVAPASGEAMIDPEALLLATTTLGRHEPRLFDEALDWLHDQADWINLQRLVRLQNDHALGDATVLSALATRLARLPAHKKWCAVVRPLAATPPPPTSLFPNDGHFGPSDPDFLAHGWLRGPVRYRGLAVAPRMDYAGNLLLKLRALFGRQSRAEVMAWLFAHETGHPAEIARQTGHFGRSIQLTLNELERSGHVRALRQPRTKHFSLHHDDWRFLATWKTPAKRAFPVWMPWAAIFRWLEQFHSLLDDESLAPASPELQAIEWRRRLDYAPFANSALPAEFTLPIETRGTDALAAHHARFRSLISLSTIN